MYKKAFDTRNVWFRFSKNFKDGKYVRFRWEQLPKERFEEYIDFKMNYFVKQEVAHVAAGIPESAEAMREYRKILVNKCENTSYYPFICCVDDESSKIVAVDALILYRRGEIYKNTTQAQTKEVGMFYKIVRERNNLCHIPDLLIKYNVDKYFDDGGCAIHPDYKGYRITTTMSVLRQIVCMTNAVSLTGAWLTHFGTQMTSRREGWKTIFEVSCEELEKKLEVKFLNAPPTFIYTVKYIY